ncbi:MAG TPA: hypothetical protein DDX92_02760 [Flavobacteriales bacterium]|jgi:hypothetical protein|nr:hypothetical protein [Flavobacteriales bacterium]
MQIRAIQLMLIFTVLQSCQIGKDDAYWNIDTLTPLAKSTVTLQQAFGDSIFTTDPNNALSLTYSSELFEFELDTLLSIPDTSTEEFFRLPIGAITLTPGQVFLADTQETSYDLQDIQLSFAIIRSGTIRFELTSTLGEQSVFLYEFAGASKNGQPIRISDTVAAGSASEPVSVIQEIDMSGVVLDLTGPDGNSFNQIFGIYQAFIDPGGNAVQITSSDFFRMKIEYLELVPDYIRGYLGNQTFNLEGTEEQVEIFPELISGNIRFEEIDLEFLVDNELGADVSFSINRFEGVNTTSGQKETLSGSIIGSNNNLNRAFEPNGATNGFESFTSSINVNDNNSNLPDFLSVLPDRISYDIGLNINPLGNISGGNDFVYYGSGAAIRANLNIPLNAAITSVLIMDTTEFTWDSTNDESINPIQGGLIWLNYKNFYPLEITAQAYLLDEQNEILDSLFLTPQSILPANIFSGNKVSVPYVGRISSTLNKARIQHLRNTKNLLIRTTFNTRPTGTTRTIYEDYKLDLRLVGDLSYEVRF